MLTKIAIRDTIYQTNKERVTMKIKITSAKQYWDLMEYLTGLGYRWVGDEQFAPHDFNPIEHDLELNEEYLFWIKIDNVNKVIMYDTVSNGFGGTYE